MEYTVYVLRNAKDKFYVGVTENISHRVEQHNAGVSKWTKNRGPWQIIWTSKAMSLSEARKFENKLKKQGRGAGFYSITGIARPSGS